MSFRNPVSVDTYLFEEGMYLCVQYRNGSFTREFSKAKGHKQHFSAHRSYRTFDFSSEEPICFKLPIFQYLDKKILTHAYTGYHVDCTLSGHFGGINIKGEFNHEIGIEHIDDSDMFVAYMNAQTFLKGLGKTCRTMYKENKNVSFKECFDAYYKSTSFALLNR